jgi:hypothetical protein
MELLFRVKKEYLKENPIYYHIDKVAINSKDGDMVRVHDINDGNEFWVHQAKLELAND